MKQKQIVAVGPKKNTIREIDIPVPNDDQLLIKTKYVGVCHSEHDDWKVAEAGMTFGHEPMGIVEQVGKNVTGFKVGDRVSGMWGGTLPGSGGMVQYAIADPVKEVVIKLPDNVRGRRFDCRAVILHDERGQQSEGSDAGNTCSGSRLRIHGMRRDQPAEDCAAAMS